MDLKQLEYFVRVAELGSFTRAAQVLGIRPRWSAAQAIARTVDWHMASLSGTPATTLCDRDIDAWSEAT